MLAAGGLAMKGNDEAPFTQILGAVSVTTVRVDSLDTAVETIGYGAVDWLVEITDVSGPANKTLSIFPQGFAARSGTGTPQQVAPLSSLNYGGAMPVTVEATELMIPFNVGTGNTFRVYFRFPCMSRGMLVGFALDIGTGTLSMSRALRTRAELIAYG